MIKDYILIRKPIAIDFSNMSKKQAEEYFVWFLKQIPERLNLLKIALKNTGYNPNKLDLTPESLIYLGQWFAKYISMHELTKEERESLKKKYSGSIKKGGLIIPLKEITKIPKKVLTEETESLCFDMGIYFAKLLGNNLRGLYWHLVTKPKSSVYYHQPVLEGFGGVQFNPQHVIRNIALKIIKNKEPYIILKKTYDIWLSCKNK